MNNDNQKQNLPNEIKTTMNDAKEKVSLGIKKGSKAVEKGARIFFKFLNMLVILALLVGVFLLGWKLGVSKFTKETSSISIVTLKNELAEISELATYEYTYTDELEKKTQLQVMDKLNVPFTTNSYRICYSGVIKAGFDLSSAEVRCEKNKVIIKLPEVNVLENYTNKDSVIVIDQKDNLLNPIKMQDVFDEITKENNRHLEEAIKQGLYEFATESAKVLIRKFVINVYGTEIDVQFR